MAEETPACELDGRQLDAAVGQAMGLEKRPVCWVDAHGVDALSYGDSEASFCYTCSCMVSEAERVHPRYSEDIAAAWEVAETGFVDVHAKWGGGYWATYSRDQGAESYTVHADTAPLAICRAALEAVRHVSPPDPPVGPSGTDTE